MDTKGVLKVGEKVIRKVGTSRCPVGTIATIINVNRDDVTVDYEKYPIWNKGMFEKFTEGKEESKMIKKGTKIEIISDLYENDIVWSKGDFFFQHEDSKTPNYKGYSYGDRYDEFMKVVQKENNLPKDETDEDTPWEEGELTPEPKFTVGQKIKHSVLQKIGVIEYRHYSKPLKKWLYTISGIELDWYESSCVAYNDDDSSEDWGQPDPIPEKEIPEELRDLEVKDEIKAMIDDFPILLEGDVGSGKTTVVMELATEFKQELVVDVMTRQTTVNMLMGYKNVTGEYIDSKLRYAYENGHMYLLEELNGGDPNVLLCLNTIENGFLSFPDKKIEAHPNFKMIATMNDITNNKDFSGRSILDLSTRDRFHTIKMMSKYADRFPEEVVSIRELVNKHRQNIGDTYNVSPRDMRRYIALSKKMSKEMALKKTMLKGVPNIEDEVLRNMIKESEDWK